MAKNTDSKPKQIVEKPLKQERPTTFNNQATDTSETLSWAKLRGLVKFFNELTSANMEIKSGRGVFAESQVKKEEEISQEWDALSGSEREKWDKRAAAECDVEG